MNKLLTMTFVAAFLMVIADFVTSATFNGNLGVLVATVGLQLYCYRF